MARVAPIPNTSDTLARAGLIALLRGVAGKGDSVAGDLAGVCEPLADQDPSLLHAGDAIPDAVTIAVRPPFGSVCPGPGAVVR